MPVSTVSVYGLGGAEDSTESLATGVQILNAEVIQDGDYEELDESPNIQFGEKGISIKRQLKAPWDRALDIGRKLKGWSEKVGNKWVYHQPATFPRIENCYVKNVEIKPFTSKPMPDEDTDFPMMNSRYSHALISVDYDTPDTDDQNSSGGPETYVSEDIEPHGEFLTLATNELFWEDNTPIAEVEAPGKILRSFAWLYTRHKMVTIPSFMFDFIGTVNKHEIRSKTLRFTFAAETLLFDEPRLSRDITSQGIQAWRVSMRMIYRPWTWNKFWRPGHKKPQFLRTPGAAFRDKDGKLKATKLETIMLEGGLDIYKPYDQNEFVKITG